MIVYGGDYLSTLPNLESIPGLHSISSLAEACTYENSPSMLFGSP